jgi:putative PIN family toxin of toxin-antitoxin system
VSGEVGGQIGNFRRIVFDTITLVSAALRLDSVPHRAFAHALFAAEVCASSGTLAELEKVLRRPKFDRYQRQDLRLEFAAILGRHVSLFAVTESQVLNVNPSCRDPKDNQFLALAAVCDADVVVSSDADLLVLHPWNGVPILTPAALLAHMVPAPGP